jgi:hypothetical protein
LGNLFGRRFLIRLRFFGLLLRKVGLAGGHSQQLLQQVRVRGQSGGRQVTVNAAVYKKIDAAGQ